MRVLSTSFLAMLFCVSLVAFVQSKIIKGKVVTNTGDPAISIAVTIKGTKTGTTTDSKGSFSIAVPKLPAILVFTAAGFETIEHRLTEKNISEDLHITLRVARTELSEVVVTAYATKRNKSMAYAITSTPPPLAVLSGKVSGLYVEKPRSKYDKALERETVSGYVNPDPKSRILTAGELSDFKKWGLWKDYTESDFKTWSDHWGMAPRTRYCVQVQNGEYKVIVGAKVYLLNNTTKDTTWSAITDNTGKAELWANINKDPNDKASYSIVCEQTVLWSPAVFENGINRITIKRACTVSNKVDIAFVVDATGSMGDEIQYLQEELQDIISKTAEKYKDVTLRTGSVFYRDHNDEYLTRHIDFQTDPSLLINFIKRQSANGGGDTPEAVEDALTTAIDSLHWDEATRAKILFLVLDAPPHDAAKNKMNELTRKAATKGIRIVPIVCSGIDKSTEYLMRCVALATNGNYVFLTDNSGVGNPHIKPTTDEFKVELLNVLLQRLIGEMIYVPACNEREKDPPKNDSITNSVKVIVYPNPTQGSVSIESSGSIKELFITDFTGKILMKMPASNKRIWTMDLSAYPSGTYLVKYFTEDKGWGTEKVVLIH